MWHKSSMGLNDLWGSLSRCLPCVRRSTIEFWRTILRFHMWWTMVPAIYTASSSTTTAVMSTIAAAGQPTATFVTEAISTAIRSIHLTSSPTPTAFIAA
mmetsp:Transcript_879/g.2014  ORF Transcript_879/g.2014 Transcript_879/m.2014 type:complete len:99 (-) Transcript_879:52-348(-)